MRYVAFSFVLAISFLILATPVYAEFLHTDILKKFYPFPITGAAAGLEDTTTTTTAETTTTTVEETTTTTTLEETTTTTTTIPEETTTTTVPTTTTTVPNETTTTTLTPGTCSDDFDCPSQMKCENYVCVDVGCVEEGGTIPGAISPEYREHMATECCEGLLQITYSGYYDENCNWRTLEGAPRGVCTNCGDRVCGLGETKCNCGVDCAQPEECPGLPISMWCPDCDIEEYGNMCLCPMATDETGCSNWDCEACVPNACPPLPVALCGVGPYAATCMPEPCPEGMIRVTIYDEKGCAVGTECVPKIINETIDCPERQTCPDGSSVPCHIGENKCICDPCPIPEEDIPDGCWQEVDKETGTINIVCKDTVCQDISRVEDKVEGCKKSGGKPIIKKDPNGCHYVDCLFGDETDPDPIDGYDECPSVEELDAEIRKCRIEGMFGAIAFEGGCKVVKCVEERGERCKILTVDMRLKVEEECGKRGLEAIKDFDENGCPFFACAGEEFCKRDLTGEAFEKCSVNGGEMVIKKDDMGCIVFSECVERGDERDVYVEPMEDIPEMTELLDIAFKLEQLKIELDKLARESDDIADYYASVDDPDEHRFRRASSMFNAITDKIDEIKNELRENLDTLTLEDMEKIRFDIRSVKESLKDIVYIMLSNSDDVKEIIEAEAAPSEIPAEGTDCGTDVGCFDSAFRICKPVTGTPEGTAGPIVTIKGLEGDACVIRVEAPSLTSLPPEMELPPEIAELVGSVIYMDCKITTYPLGIQNPEEDIFPYCEGPMMLLVRAFGSKAIQANTQPEQFDGPGGCAAEKECKEFCEEQPDVCLEWCEDNPEMCPPEAGIDLKEAIEGRPFVMCTLEGESAFKECGDRGGFGQSDPSVFSNATKESCTVYGKGCCEEYTGCLMPEMGECGCTLAEGCAVSCSDYSYGQMNCEDHLADGCVWSVGGIEVQPCTGCMNNGVCDVGECGECRDCLSG